jgi:hypothetical protein
MTFAWPLESAPVPLLSTDATGPRRLRYASGDADWKPVERTPFRQRTDSDDPMCFQSPATQEGTRTSDVACEKARCPDGKRMGTESPGATGGKMRSPVPLGGRKRPQSSHLATPDKRREDTDPWSAEPLGCRGSGLAGSGVRRWTVLSDCELGQMTSRRNRPSAGWGFCTTCFPGQSSLVKRPQAPHPLGTLAGRNPSQVSSSNGGV